MRNLMYQCDWRTKKDLQRRSVREDGKHSEPILNLKHARIMDKIMDGDLAAVDSAIADVRKVICVLDLAGGYDFFREECIQYSIA